MADANNVLATAEPWAYVVMAYMGSLSTVDIVKSLQCLLVCQSFSAVTDKIGKQKKVFLLSKIYEDFQARVNEPGIYAKFIPASCSVATAEISRRLLCSRGVTALTAESLWAKKDDVCKQIRKAEPMYLSMYVNPPVYVVSCGSQHIFSASMAQRVIQSPGRLGIVLLTRSQHSLRQRVLLGL